MEKLDAPTECSWNSGTVLILKVWSDNKRYTPLLNWTPIYRISYSNSGRPFDWLACQASQASGTAALHVTFFDQSFLLYKPVDHWKPRRTIGPPKPPVDEESLGYIDALLRLRRCLVIMRVIIIHTTVERSQGLFGLAGDSRVQVLDTTADPDKVRSLFTLARSSTSPLLDDQDMMQDTPEKMETVLKTIMVRRFCSDRLNELVRPAIMVRLCTRFCKRNRNNCWNCEIMRDSAH